MTNMLIVLIFIVFVFTMFDGRNYLFDFKLSSTRPFILLLFYYFWECNLVKSAQVNVVYFRNKRMQFVKLNRF